MQRSRRRPLHVAGDSLINRACQPGRADWYHAVVPLIPVVPSPVAAGVRMHAGQTITVDYHLPGVREGGPPGPLVRYVGHCRAFAADPA